MSLTPIECANCGAKYRLPETFQADKAKCKKCGAMIDVAGQKSSPPAAAPKRTKPAGATASTASRAKPARRSRRPQADGDDDAPAKKSSRRSSSSRSQRGSSRRGEDGEGDESGSGRREPKKSNTALIAGSIIGILAIVLVVVIFAMQGEDEKPTDGTQQAKAPEPEAPSAEVADASVERRAEMRKAVAALDEADRTAIEKFLDAADNGDGELEAGLTDVGNEAMLRFAADSLKIVGASAEATVLANLAEGPELDDGQRQQVVAVVATLARSKTDPDSQQLAGMLRGFQPKAEPAAAKKPAAGKKTGLASHEDVFKPSEVLEPLPWPDFVTEEERAEITEALGSLKDGGLQSTRAKTRLEEFDGKSLIAIANYLGTLNYFDSEDTMVAYELNRLLGAMSAGINAGFRSQELGDEIPLEDADWNGKTVNTWRKFALAYGSDENALKEKRAERLKDAGK